MGFFNPRIEKTSTKIKVSRVQQIEALNRRLDNAREILAGNRVFPGLNKEAHFVVSSPQENGYYIVNAEGCCPIKVQGLDLLEGDCEHRLAVDLFEEAQEAISQPPGDEEKVETATNEEIEETVEATVVEEDMLPLTELVVDRRNGKRKAAHSNGKTSP